ncbi:hypothetical protein PENNAL_c0004G07724 [Penicillium nalgiovense]|uniref:Uncharacterized protein n=1 Tax=Penicillium nalgiovense TaxID=60175 RepID=A0A1V6Z4G5_PENNA|nr:hypothetical protein PENNAL_c0004G07724 [Penicillium nalgiovense]
MSSSNAAKLAGRVHTHEGALYNPLARVLAISVITHDGNADLSQLDLEHVCRQGLPPALQMKNLFTTESSLRIAGAEMLASCPGRTTHQGKNF